MSLNPQGVHLVGSIPFSSAAEVFSTVCSVLPNRLRRLPDGETADRSQWVHWQTNTFKHVPRLQRCIDSKLEPEESPSIHAEQIPAMLGELRTGYDRVALESYRIFSQMKAEGIIPLDVQFQVSIPTPLAAVQRAVDPHYHAVVEPHFEAAMQRDLKRIQAEIPHSELAIQFDVMAEIFILERAFENQPDIEKTFGKLGPWFDDIETGVHERLVRALGFIDSDVDVGFHMCYGDQGHKHFMEPLDMGLMTDFAEFILTSIQQRVAWIHMPVPKDRTDIAYFEPLRKIVNLLQERKVTLALGLVHSNDLAGTRARLHAAAKVLGESVSWSVATECGMGRTPPEEVNGILEISRTVSQPLS